LGFRVYGLGFGVWVFTFRVWDLGFEVWILLFGGGGVWFYGLWFMVYGVVCSV